MRGEHLLDGIVCKGVDCVWIKMHTYIHRMGKPAGDGLLLAAGTLPAAPRQQHATPVFGTPCARRRAKLVAPMTGSVPSIRLDPTGIQAPFSPVRRLPSVSLSWGRCRTSTPAHASLVSSFPASAHVLFREPVRVRFHSSQAWFLAFLLVASASMALVAASAMSCGDGVSPSTCMVAFLCLAKSAANPPPATQAPRQSSTTALAP
eukprot:scaffold492_cov341-Pavlova_lutheri.AAC.18